MSIDPERWETLEADAARLRKDVVDAFPALAEARRRWARSKDEADFERLREVQADVEARQAKLSAAIDAMAEYIGLEPDDPAIAAAAATTRSDAVDRRPRRSLTQDKVESTGFVDEDLPVALDALERLTPAGWADEEPAERGRLSELTKAGSFLSLTKNVRAESEAPSLHRFRQALHAARDYIEGAPLYDHFAGASLIPMVTQLGRRLEVLQEVGGSSERLERLWAGPSADVDGTLLELLVGGAAAAMGRRIEYIPETHEKSADMRCHDPIPMVIECKRQRSLSDYELSEEAVMRDVFRRLQVRAGALGLHGRFEVRLDVEASTLDVEDVVAKLAAQRLAPHPERELAWPWGRVAFRELPRRAELPFLARLYSPDLLRVVFGWDCDLPDWDGICCTMANAGDVVLGAVTAPLALVWTNVSAEAVRKRSWAPMNLFGAATKQIPPGEFGVIYTAYVEGARDEVADARLQAFTARIEDFEHAANIRVPVALLSRLYPRALAGGQPDLIESTVQYCSSACGDPAYFDVLPSRVFT